MTDRITISPHQCHGAPCIRGMRIRVADVLEMLGMRSWLIFPTSNGRISGRPSPTRPRSGRRVIVTA